ncbi:tetratricopeptide repeat protein 28-like isoform X2 [Actinia tenebrosa]|uniref:Tetratricopeptide repeat protein 28-like isoform X2 n=1 Tax=Actinia tenebrosa TaxID=6105 RepID=A0A6P8IUG1_ACTTE|nr:tetratricopeptide repeat protein 28-like isoform X2 [Actinia tenebrosa]
MANTMGDSRGSEEEEESVDKEEEMADANEYLQKGMAHLIKKEYDDVIFYSEKCLAIVQEYSDKVVEMGACCMLAEAHFSKEEYDDAIFYSEKCLAIAQESGDKVVEMYAYTTLGIAHLKKDKCDDAISYSKKCLFIAQESGNKEVEVKLYMTLGVAHWSKEEYDDAIFYSKKCLFIAQESGVKVVEMTACRTLGIAHWSKEEYDDAIFYSEKCLAIAQESGVKVVEMTACRTLGIAHFSKEEYDDAIFYSEKCLAIAQESGDTVVEMTACRTLGKAHFSKEEYDDAIFYSEKCLAIAQESDNKVVQMYAYNTLGIAHLKKDRCDDAISYTKKCLFIAQESGNKKVEMKSYVTLGKVDLNKEEYDDALFYSEKCLFITQEAGNKVVEIESYVTLGIAHLSKEEYDDAISYSKKCLFMAQESGDKVVEMKSYMTLGNAHLKKKEYNDAMLYLENCLAIAQESGDKEVKMYAYIMLGDAHLKKDRCDDAIYYSKKCLATAQESGNKVVELKSYMTLGNAHLHKEEYDHAIFYGEKYLFIAQEYGDKKAEIDAYMLLGVSLFKKEEYDNAIFYVEKFLFIAQEYGDKKAEIDGYMLLGVFLFKKEEYDDAILYLEKCLAIAQESGDKVAEISAYDILGSVNHKGGKYDDAYTYFRKGMSMEKDLKDKRNVSNLRFKSNLHIVNWEVGIFEEVMDDATYTSLFETACADACTQGIFHCIKRCEHHLSQGISQVHAFLGQYDKAIECYKEALNGALVDGDKTTFVANCHYGLGKAYYNLGQTEEAEKSFKDSLKHSEFIFDHLAQNDRFKIAFIDRNIVETSKMLLKVLIDKNNKEEALVLSDHYRAKALKDLLVLSYGMTKEPIAKEGLHYADVQSLVSSSSYTLLFYVTYFKELCTFLIEAGNELECSVQLLEYREACLDKLVDKTFDDIKVRQVVNCEDRSLDHMHYFEKKKNRKEDELTELLTRQKENFFSDQYRSACGSRGNPSQFENIDESSLTSGLEILYHKLIHNIKCLIKQEEIVIIPEGPLYKVPFAALRDPDTGRYLSETKRIRLAPSITSLKLLQECPVEHHSSTGALIIGGPLVGRVMMDGTEKDVGYLEGALDEALDTACILGVRPLLAAVATKPAVLEKLRQGVSVVHIAAHGILSKATIVLAPSPEIRATKIPDEEDYMLTMAEVQQAQVGAQLIVLSCCHSGRGEIKSEGVIGMCRAFLASGARAVVGSLWAIDDQATREFMVKFYTHLKDGKSASTSLHLTMNDMRRTPQYSEPKYWAPFFLMGDDVTIQFKH